MVGCEGGIGEGGLVVLYHIVLCGIALCGDEKEEGGREGYDDDGGAKLG